MSNKSGRFSKLTLWYKADSIDVDNISLRTMDKRFTLSYILFCRKTKIFKKNRKYHSNILLLSFPMIGLSLFFPKNVTLNRNSKFLKKKMLAYIVCLFSWWFKKNSAWFDKSKWSSNHLLNDTTKKYSQMDFTWIYSATKTMNYSLLAVSF